jgi:hypothetical protein
VPAYSREPDLAAMVFRTAIERRGVVELLPFYQTLMTRVIEPVLTVRRVMAIYAYFHTARFGQPIAFSRKVSAP